MKNLYIKLSSFVLLVFLLVFSNNAFAQKNLKLKILTIAAASSSGTNGCDYSCICCSDSQIDWVWDIDDGATDVDEDCYNLSDDANNNSNNPNFNVWNRNYDYACQWPGGNIDFNVEGWDEDCADACIGGGFGNVVSDRACTVNVNRAFPSDVNGTYGPYTATCNYNRNFDGSGNCSGTITVTYQWEVTGSYVSQTGDNFICGAANLGTLNSGATLTRNNFNNYGYSTEDICAADEPNNGSGDETVWMKFTTGPNPGTNINVDASAIGGSGSGGILCIAGETSFAWCRVYEGPATLTGCPFSYSTNHFTQIAQVGSTGIDASDIDIKCPKPNQTYYVQVETQGISTCDMARFNLTVRDNGKVSGPDRICNAANLGTFTNGTDISLDLYNQSNQCATVGSCEPDDMSGSLDKTVWYKFTTPPAYYSDGTLPNLYTVEIERTGGGLIDHIPAYTLWRETTPTTRNCPESCASFANLTPVGSETWTSIGNALRNLCLTPSTTYYIQVDHTCASCVFGIDDYVEFNVHVKKSTYQPPNNICDAVDLGYITSNGTATGTATNINWNNSNIFSGAPFNGLPHSNRCKTAQPSEPGATLGQDETVWYKFTTGNNAPDWIGWYETDGTCAAPGLLSSFFNSRVNFYKSNSTATCPVGTNLDLQPERNLPGELCDVNTGLGFGAPCYADFFRLKCPEPNTTYWVQVQAASFSVCEEGLWSFNNGSSGWIKTAPTLNAGNPWDEPCTAYNLGSVPNGSSVSGSLDNFCATARQEFRADFNQPLERDVWIKFKPPTSGSVRITATSGTSSGLDNDLDIQMACWEPVMGELVPGSTVATNTQNHCGDLRYLWTPRLAQDHGIQEATEAGSITVSYYDIYNTCGNSVLCNEGNSFIVTCLDPQKTYFLQVDGGQYFGCDLLDAGDCIMGNFTVTVADASLGSIDPSNPTNGTTGNQPAFVNDEPCFARLLPVQGAGVSYGSLSWNLMSNRCATSITDPIPSRWQAVNSSTDNTVWARFFAPSSGRVKIRAENIGQIKGDADWHDDINLQLAVYTTDRTCYDKYTFTEVITNNESGFDGALDEANPASDEYVNVCVCGVFPTCGYDEYYTVKCLIPGKEYFIMIDGDAGYTCNADGEDILGDFRISVQDVGGTPRSTNDSVCQAYEILNTASLAVNASITTGNFNNECATIQPWLEGPGKLAEKINDDDIISFGTVDVEHTLWFKFRAPSTGKVLIEGINSGSDDLDIGMALYDFPFENCTNAAQGIKIAQDYDAGVVGFGIDEDFYVECLVPGRMYYLQVDGDRNAVYNPLDPNGTETGEFKIRITHQNMGPRADIPPQNNDSLCDAINFGTIVNGGSVFRNDDNNRCATSEQNEPDVAGWNVSYFINQDRTVWYQFNTGANPGAITINVSDPKPSLCFDVDIDLFEYTGTYSTSVCDAMALSSTQFNPLLKVAEGDIAGIGQSESINLDCPKPNKTYFLRVTGSGGLLCAGFGPDEGTFDVSIAVANSPATRPVNDDICNAVNLGNLNSGTTLSLNNQNNNCATQELNEPNTSQSCLADQSCYDETVWYSFTTGANPGQVTINMDVIGNSLADFYGNVSLFEYVGGSCSSFSSFDYMLQSSPFSNGFHDAQITAPCLKANTTYYLQCDGWDVGPLGLVGVSEQGLFNISVSDNAAGFTRPFNDNLANALPVQSGTLTAGGTLTVSGYNKCATCENNEQGGMDNCGTDGTAHTAPFNAEDETVWYYFITPSKPGVTTVTVADDPGVSGTFSPNFRIYYNNGSVATHRITGAPTSKLIQEGSSATGTSVATNTYTCLLPNTIYWVQIDGNDLIPFTTDQGNFILTVTDDGSGNPGPGNDLICNAASITIPVNSSVLTNGTNKCSWEEVNEPNTSNNQGGTGDDVTADGYDETVWYTFIPPSDGTVSINNLSVGYNYVLYERNSTAAITGCPDPVWAQLNPIAFGTASVTALTESWGCLDDAKRYYLQIDGNDGPGVDVGNFSFTLAHTGNTIIGNDMICGAANWGTVTAGGASSLSQNNQCATEECGEPSVSGNCNDVTAVGYDKTLWYKFTTNANKGTYTITVANNGSPSDLIAPSLTVYRQNATVCSGSVPDFSAISFVKQNLNLGASTSAQSLSLNCWEAEPNKTYYVQVDGNDLNETGNNFNVSISYVATPVPNDDICNAISITVGGAAVSGDNTCAGTQANEPNLSPSAPQDPTVSGYDETVWYSFIAPPSGSARVTFGGLGVLAVGLNIDLNVLQAPSGNPSISCAASNQFAGLTNNSSTTIPRNNLANTHDLTCLIPGRKYYLQVDGSDASLVDRGTFTVAVSDLDPSFVAGSTVPNDEPCGAVDITQYIRTVVQGPCPSNTSSYTGQYIVTGGSPNIDRATQSAQGSPCNGPNCSDYWFKITVPNDAYGIRIQGDEQNESINHTENVTVYRPSTNCSGTMNQIGCGTGGFFSDVDFSVAAAPGEVLYISVNNSAGTMGTNPATSANNFGLCLSPVCPPKPACNATLSPLLYGQPQCWNMDVDGSNLQPLYYDCLPGSNNSRNYFVFNTDCDVNGLDTITMVFSVTDIGGSSIFCGTQTAMSIFEDATPCDGSPDATLLNCVIWDDVSGGTTASNVAQTWILPECKSYVVQIISNQNDGDCASGGQIVVLPSLLIPTQILPVELTTFTGYNNGSINVLNWTTASELNSLKFVVEKSIDAVHFEYLGERPAAGNSSIPLNYTLDDNHPVIGNNYYRLKMIDKDGTFKYSEIISIKITDAAAPSDGIVAVYPNPTNDKVNVVYQSGAAQKINLDVFNAVGQNMYNNSYQFNAGLNTIVIDAVQYAKGMYIINLQNITSGNKYLSKFVKE